MSPDKFTNKTAEILGQTQALAFEREHAVMDVWHLLSTLLTHEDSVTPYLLEALNVNANQLLKEVNVKVDQISKVGKSTTPMPSQAFGAVLLSANKYCKDMGDDYISIEHLLLGLSDQSHAASSLLKSHKITFEGLKKAILNLRNGEKVQTKSAENNYNVLDKYARNLNDLAKEGKLDPVIGRDEEIRRVLHILSRRTKNNPILIGEPGVGKTAIAEGIAHRIINNDVPENLKSKILYSLDMAALMAGAKFRGEFEERLKGVIKAVTDSTGEIILFIDEIHTLIGAGAIEGGSMDAANILKPALARGDLRAVGATTLNEYQKYFEKDKALVRRFQIVQVDEPKKEDSISILRGLKERYENHHKVKIKDEAIISSVELSSRYITDRFLPDKAIDLIDEAAAKIRLEIDSLPESLDELERKVRQLEIEREAIRQESKDQKTPKLDHELQALNSERSIIRAKWEKEKSLLNEIQDSKQKIEDFKLAAEQLERQGEYGRVAEIRYGRIKELENKVTEKEKELSDINPENRFLSEEVNSQDIAEVVAKWTGIPVTKMLESEKQKLLRMEASLGEQVKGQKRAIEVVSDAVRRSRSGLQKVGQPIGNFLFLGSTGVGKTELSKVLAEYLFNDRNALIRIDMSEYQEKHNVSRLIGSPPGYIGYEEGGQLTEAVRRKPYSVILLDEIEKAHPDVFNILLQVLDEGRLTDNKGRVANFTNAVIIMTSNIGSDIILEGAKDPLSDHNITKLEVTNRLKQFVKPEFINRIDEIVLFDQLGQDEIKAIAQLQLNELKERARKAKVKVDFDQSVLDWLAQHGYDDQYGARPLNRLIEKEITNPLSKMILANEVLEQVTIMVHVKNGVLQFENLKLPELGLN